MINIKKQNGITLVALVVTIVVLLILAGVSINMVLGNNGLITKAKDAKTKTEQDQINMETGMNNLYDEMMAILGENGGSESSGTGGSDGDGNEGGVDLSSLAIGDYVNYTYDTEDSEGNALTYSLLSTQSGYDDDQTVVQSATTLKWIVLNIDEENGTIDLISANSTDNKVYLQGALGYNNGVYLLNDICEKLYSNSALGIKARSINLEDIERHLTPSGITTRNSYKSETDTVYGTTYTYESDRNYPNIYANEKGQGIGVTDGSTIQQPTLDGSVLDPYNASSKYYTTPTTETSSNANTALTVTQTYYKMSLDETNYGPAAHLFVENSPYWVSSRFVDTGLPRYKGNGAAFVMGRVSRDTFYGVNLYNSYGTKNYSPLTLRPVVNLESSLLDGTKDASGAWNLVSE